MLDTAPAAPPPVARLVEEAARHLGYDFVVLDETFGYLFEVRDGDRTITLIGGVSPANPLFAGRLCKDKFYTGLVLERAGFRVPRSVRCLSPRFFRQPDYAPYTTVEPGRALAEELGFPLIVKPNRLSKGIGVFPVESVDAMTQSIEALWNAGSNVVLVQERVSGRDLRLNFVDDEFVGGYERSQLVLRGDGSSALRDLVAAADPRGASEEFLERVRAEVGSVDLVLAAGEERALGCKTVLNLNQLATGRVIEEIPQAWCDYCLGIGRAVGASHFGLDVRAPGLDHDPASMVVIEINDSPLLTGLYELGHEDLAVRGQAKALALAFANL